jgi:uncharacterized heparinase superfamily protein
MGLPEIVCRSRQAAAKRLERLGLLGHVEDRFQQGASRDSAVDPWRFFIGAGEREMAALLKKEAPGARESIIASAEAALEGRLDLLGHEGLRFGEPLDWHSDPTTARRAPLAHWSRLDPLDPNVVGDAKVVWELNRHQWLVRLAQAYRLSGDERYARSVAARLTHWMAANPTGTGINWTSSLETALRLMSWCWVLALLEGSRALTPDLVRAVRAAIAAHATHVERYLSYYFSPNTHLTGEALGLVYAGVLTTEMPQALRWRETGTRILVDELSRQVLPDGVYFEQATWYQRYTVDIYLQLLMLGARNGLALPDSVRDGVERMLDFLLAIRWPNGSMPQIGDADGGRLLPLAPRAADDYRDIFSTAAVLFQRADYAWAAGRVAPETLWLLGAGGASTFSELGHERPSGPPSRRFADGGYAVMRSDWGSRAHQLIFDAGPLGCPVSGAHGHADLLSVQCAAFGEPCLVDPGTFGYADPRWRDHYRGTAAHSTVTVDGEGQAVAAGPFRWLRRPAARLRQWQSDEAYDFAEASHDGYARLKDPVTHRRRVLFVKPRYWVVVDDLQGAAEHTIAVRFQLGPMPVTVDASGWARAGSPDGPGLLIRSFSASPLKCEIHEGELSPVQGWVSRDYGRHCPAPALVYSAVARLPVRVLSLIVPTEHVAGPLPEVATLTGEDAGLTGLSFGRGSEAVRFDDRGFLVERR